MKEVKLDGKKYIRTAVASERFGYSQDYLGQLSREGRIDAKRVGRSWFVNPDSIKTYQAELELEANTSTGGDHSDKDTTSHTIKPVQKQDSEIHKVKIHKVEQDKTTKVISKISKTKPMSAISYNRDSKNLISDNRDIHKKSINHSLSYSKHVVTHSTPRWQSISYEEDSADLLPNTQKNSTHTQKSTQPQSRQTAVDITDDNQTQKTIRVHSNTDRYSIVPSELPTVRLQGRIPVKSDTDDSDSSSDNLLPISELQHHFHKQSKQAIIDSTKQDGSYTTHLDENLHHTSENSTSIPKDKTAYPTPTKYFSPRLFWLLIILLLTTLSVLVLTLETLVVFDKDSGTVVSKIHINWSLLSHFFSW